MFAWKCTTEDKDDEDDDVDDVMEHIELQKTDWGWDARLVTYTTIHYKQPTHLKYNVWKCTKEDNLMEHAEHQKLD